jgi:hypothetical protein
LLRGNAGAWFVRNCDGTATKAFCSVAPSPFLPGMAAVYGYVVVTGDGGPVQRSPKCDRGSPGCARPKPDDPGDDAIA